MLFKRKKKKYVYFVSFIGKKGDFYKTGAIEVTLNGKVKSMADIKTTALHIANTLNLDGMPMVTDYQLLRKERAD